MVNKVILVGRLVKDPVFSHPRPDLALCNFNLAVSSPSYSNNAENTQYIRCVIFQKAAEVFCKYTSKGSLVYIEGRIDNSSYEDKNGEKRYSTSVIVNQYKFLSSNKPKNNIEKSLKTDFDFKDNNSNNDGEVKATFAEDIDWGEGNE